MTSESSPRSHDDLLDEISARFDEFETELNEKIEEGRGQIDDLADDVRARIEELRDGDHDPDESTVEALQGRLDALSAELQEEIDEGTQHVSSLLDDIKGKARELEEKLSQG